VFTSVGLVPPVEANEGDGKTFFLPRSRSQGQESNDLTTESNFCSKVKNTAGRGAYLIDTT
jgi:hypothetical protein